MLLDSNEKVCLFFVAFYQFSYKLLWIRIKFVDNMSFLFCFFFLEYLQPLSHYQETGIVSEIEKYYAGYKLSLQ